MTRDELITILKSVGCPVNEGENTIDNGNSYPRIVFFVYAIENDMASGDNYHDLLTYQISMFSQKPFMLTKEILQLRKAFQDEGLYPTISSEYVEEKDKNRKYWHFYFKIEVLDDLDAVLEGLENGL